MVFGKDQVTPHAFPKSVTDVLEKWLRDHAEEPYPQNAQLEELAASTGLEVKQVKWWLSDARVKHAEEYGIDKKNLKEWSGGPPLPEKARRVLEKFVRDNAESPYANPAQAKRLAQRGGIDVKQVMVWLYNARQQPERYGIDKTKLKAATLPEQARKVLQEFVSERAEHPYADPAQAQRLAEQGNIEVKQVLTWLENWRKAMKKRAAASAAAASAAAPSAAAAPTRVPLAGVEQERKRKREVRRVEHDDDDDDDVLFVGEGVVKQEVKEEEEDVKDEDEAQLQRLQRRQRRRRRC